MENKEEIIEILQVVRWSSSDIEQQAEKICNLFNVTSTLPNIDSTEFRNWLKSELYEQTLNRFVYKRGGFEYYKDVLYKHYTNQLQFGN